MAFIVVYIVNDVKIRLPSGNIPLRDRNPASDPESLARDLEAGRGLAALVFVHVNQPDHAPDCRFVETRSDYLRSVFVLDDV
jgi:hypothetical protein